MKLLVSFTFSTSSLFLTGKGFKDVIYGRGLWLRLRYDCNYDMTFLGRFFGGLGLPTSPNPLNPKP